MGGGGGGGLVAWGHCINYDYYIYLLLLNEEDLFTAQKPNLDKRNKTMFG